MTVYDRNNEVIMLFMTALIYIYIYIYIERERERGGVISLGIIIILK